uniref:Bestrophin homolog n=1 Tax=Acrobeloides nanus TaxID=290746 RepID=A0A914CBV4_9BILA
MEKKIDYIPIVLLLGFFVMKVLQRWQGIFENIGFIDGAALTTCVYIRGSDKETEAVRRNILRYLCLTQVLVLRDISIPVRKRFPSIESIVSMGYLLPHERNMMIAQMPHAEQYWLPIGWAISLVGQQLEMGHIEEDTYANAILYVNF